MLVSVIGGAASCGRYSDQRTDRREESFVAEPTLIDHPHRESMMGGYIASIGRDEFHAEAVLESDGKFSVFILNADANRLHEVHNQVLTAYARAAELRTSEVVILKPAPLGNDTAERTSRFMGQLPVTLLEDSFVLTMPGLQIDGERFTVRIEILKEVRSGMDVQMPEAATVDEAKELYLTAGGLYTESDIDRNNRMTAAEKYKGFRAKHDPNPNVGETICPITGTKANAACSWVIGDETYYFCCPPCIDEFVRLAKEEPDQVLAPEEYVRRAD